MNILWLQWRDIKHPSAGGAEVYMHQICRRLSQKGHKVHAITSWHPGLKRIEVIDGYIVQRIGDHDSYILHIPNMLRVYRNWPHVIIEDTSKIPLFTPILYLSRKIPVIAVVHHLNRDIYFQELPLFKAIIAFILERAMPKLYTDLPNTYLISVSKSTKQELIRLGAKPQRICIILNGVDYNLHNSHTHASKSKSPCPVVLWFSRYKRYKQPYHALIAFVLASKRIPNMKMIIAGKGTKILRKIVDSLQLENVEVLGEVKEKMKAKLMQQAWVLICTSRKEGFGLTVLEANAHGTPAVSYDVPGLRDSIKNMKTGILVPYGDIKALSKALTTLLKDQELLQKMACNSLNWVTHFNWNISYKHFERVIESILD